MGVKKESLVDYYIRMCVRERITYVERKQVAAAMRTALIKYKKQKTVRSLIDVHSKHPVAHGADKSVAGAVQSFLRRMDTYFKNSGVGRVPDAVSLPVPARYSQNCDDPRVSDSMYD